jgi:phosphoserine phosphatase
VLKNFAAVGAKSAPQPQGPLKGREFVHKLKNSVALLDWDGTIRDGFTIMDWVGFLLRRKLVTLDILCRLKDAFSARAHGKISHDELAFRAAAIYADSLSGSHCECISKEAMQFIDQDRCKILPLSLEIIRYFQAQKLQVVVVSGAPHEVISCYRKLYGLSEIHGLQLETKSGIYTGNIVENPGISAGKREVVSEMLAAKTGSIVVAMGNSDSDMPLFDAAKVKIVVNNPSVRTAGACLHLNGTMDLHHVLDWLCMELPAFGSAKSWFRLGGGSKKGQPID